MNNTSRKWAVSVGTSAISTVLQHTAFGYGYRWACQSRAEVSHNGQIKFLVFDPDTKQITWSGTRTDTESFVNSIANTIEDAVANFENPPRAVLKVGSDCIVDSNGNVQIKGCIVSGTLFDTLVEERNAFLGNKPAKRKLPVVQFMYTSQNSGRKLRSVLVTAMDFDSISGLDVNDGHKFKRYLQGKITGPINLMSFAEEP